MAATRNDGSRLSALNTSAINACYVYEVVQEIHRLSQCVYVEVQGICDTAAFLWSYLRILPRVSLVKCETNTNALNSIPGGACTVLISASPMDKGPTPVSGKKLAISIDDSNISIHSLLSTKNSLDPNAWLYPNYAKPTFSQALPVNISATFL